jgi:hypothetical protein
MLVLGQLRRVLQILLAGGSVAVRPAYRTARRSYMCYSKNPISHTNLKIGQVNRQTQKVPHLHDAQKWSHLSS